MSDFLLLVECLLSNTWMVLTGVKYPGLDVSIAAIFCGVMIIFVSIRLLKRIFGG